jgi:hypothetical protein
VSDNGPEPYRLADGIQDHRIALAIEEAAHHNGIAHVAEEPWH